jgi:hypothetical protein
MVMQTASIQTQSGQAMYLSYGKDFKLVPEYAGPCEIKVPPEIGADVAGKLIFAREYVQQENSTALTKQYLAGPSARDSLCLDDFSVKLSVGTAIAVFKHWKILKPFPLAKEPVILFKHQEP